MFVLNIVNTLLYHLDHKILIITNNSMKSIPEIKMSAHTHARTLKRTLLSSVKSQSNCPVAYIKGYNPTHSSALIQPPVMPPSWAKLLSLAFQPHPGFSCHLLFSLPSNSLLPFQLGLLTGPRTPCFLAFLPLLGCFPHLECPLPLVIRNFHIFLAQSPLSSGKLPLTCPAQS